MNGEVLIIEDDKDINELMKLSLSTKGYNILNLLIILRMQNMNY